MDLHKIKGTGTAKVNIEALETCRSKSDPQTFVYQKFYFRRIKTEKTFKTEFQKL